MAHEIVFDDARQINPIAFVGETPWHGLGQQLTPGQPLEIWAKEAGMDFSIGGVPVQYALRTPTALGSRVTNFNYPARQVLFREDNNAPLSIVSNSYKVVQPLEVLDFFRSLIETAGFKMNTAGVLFGGAKYWALAETGAETRIMGQDAVRGFLLLATACDGSLATTAKNTSVRVVCNNTLDFATAEGGVAIKIPHSTKFDADQVKAQLGLAHQDFAQFAEQANVLARRKVSDHEALTWLARVFGQAKEDGEINLDELNLGQARNIKTCLELFKGRGKGSNLKSSDGTAWGLVNSVTEWADHARNTRSQDAKLNGAWFGDQAALKQQAFAAALKLAA